MTGLLAALTGGTVAFSATGDGAAKVAAAGTPPPVVEDYSYPGAAAIEAETGIKLIEGDGGIVKTSCDTTESVITVDSVELGSSCYKVVGPQGWLNMEIPRVYAIQGDDHTVDASLTVNGSTEQVELSPGEYNPVGEGKQPPNNDPATLVELRVS